MSISPDIEHAKSVFQIPKKWFADIDESVKGMYGVNMVQVNHDGQEGAIEVKVDEVMLSNFVKSIASETSSGTVAAVDGVLPDNTGNVNFNLPSGKWMKTDGNGHIKTTDEQPVTVLSTEHGFLYNDNGALQYKDYGTSADTVAEGNHEHGKITNDGKMSGCIGTSCLVVTDNSGNIIHSDGILSEQSWAGSDVQTLVNLVGAFEWDENTGKPKVTSPVKSVDGVEPGDSGNIELKSIRHITGQAEPDSEGRVTLSGFVKSVNNKRPDANGNVSVDVGGTVKSVDNIQPDTNGNVALTGYVKSVNNVAPGSNGNVTLNIPQTYVQSIDGLTGDVTLQGAYADFIHNHTHDQITDWNDATASFVDTLDVASKGVTAGLDWDNVDQYVCPTNHGHKSSDIVDLQTNGLSGVVKLSGDQIVTGKKTFTREITVYKNDRYSALSEEAVTIGGHSILTFENDVNYYLDNAPNVPKTNLSSQVIATCGYINTSLSNLVTLDTEQEISAMKTFKGGARTPAGFFVTTSNNSLVGGMYDNSGAFAIEASAGKDLLIGTTKPNGAQLFAQPTDTSKTSLAIATCGYVQSQLSAATGNVKTVQNVAPGDNGNIDLSEVFALKEHTHTTEDITDWDEATQLFVETTDVESDGVVIDGTTSHERYVCPTKHKHTIAAIEGAIKSVDGHQADENGAVSFGLTPDKYVKADASGHLTSYSGTLLEVPEGKTPFNGTFKCVTNVTWNGTQLVIASKNLEFTNGVLTSASDNANTTIATTTYSGS